MLLLLHYCATELERLHRERYLSRYGYARVPALPLMSESSQYILNNYDDYLSNGSEIHAKKGFQSF